MKCPHCYQEHPEGTKFCPETGGKILKACTLNPECPDQGKYILPLDSIFCPTCGYKLEDVLDERNNNDLLKIIDKNLEIWYDGLFPINNIYLGISNIFNIYHYNKIEECSIGYTVGNPIRPIQRYEDDYINAVFVSYMAKELPQKWQEILGFTLFDTKEQCAQQIRNRHLKISKYDENHWIVEMPNRNIIMGMIFGLLGLESVEVTLGRCPDCHALNVNITFSNFDDINMLCQECGKEWP